MTKQACIARNSYRSIKTALYSGFTEVPTAMGPPMLIMQPDAQGLTTEQKAVLGGALGVGTGALFSELAGRKIKSRLGNLLEALPGERSRRGAALAGLAALGALIGIKTL